MPVTPSEFQQHFDYIVIGAGTAGCVLAARLSENPDHRVCLIEAGGSEKHPYVSIPAGAGAAIMNPKMGWGLSTTPQAALNGRQVPLPRGKIIGGSGSINGMAYSGLLALLGAMLALAISLSPLAITAALRISVS